MNNVWQFIDGDIILSSDDEEQMKMANVWIANLVQAIRLQTIEELENGRNELSDNTKGSDSTEDHGNPTEVPC
jgi:hypothetical protein